MYYVIYASCPTNVRTVYSSHDTAREADAMADRLRREVKGCYARVMDETEATEAGYLESDGIDLSETVAVDYFAAYER